MMKEGTRASSHDYGDAVAKEDMKRSNFAHDYSISTAASLVPLYAVLPDLILSIPFYTASWLKTCTAPAKSQTRFLLLFKYRFWGGKWWKVFGLKKVVLE